MTSTIMPLFPLSTILFPDGLLPLQIFELRYLAMVKKCIADGTEFGVVAQAARLHQPEASAATSTVEPMSQESFVSVGTFAKIISHTSPQPGLLRIDCIGGKRFKILSSEQQKLGLWVAQVSPIEADLAIVVPEELADTVMALRQLITALTSQATDGQRLPMTKPYLFDDCGWVANRWCELIPMRAEQRQRLLTLENPLIRLELVQDLLKMGGFLQ
jgi:Lon protease-like protein